MNATLSQWVVRLHLLVAFALVPVLAQGADRKSRLKPEDYHQVELFAAMKSGEIEVRFIPKDIRSANVLIRNKSGKPLSVRLPDAFAGVPVLAQFGGGAGGVGGGLGGMPGGAGGGLGGGGGMGGGGQAMGGGFGGGMMGGMGGGMMGGMGGMGGGFFNVAPDKVGKIRVKTLCLEHGKADPTPRIKYELRPITSFTKDTRAAELCRMVARGEVPQNAAQAVAWNMLNGIAWQELARKERFRSQFTGQYEMYFSPLELQMAGQIASAVAARAEKDPQNTEVSPGEQVSTSQSQSFAGDQ